MRGNPVGDEAVAGLLRSIPAYAGEPARQCFVNTPSAVYPRVCGGTVAPEPHSRFAWGLSPRMRGNPLQPLDCDGENRSIPAYAGEPAVGSRKPLLYRVYPRVCGGTDLFRPRACGNTGSIPAYAGEPARQCFVNTASAVYPRVCGGTLPSRSARRFSLGLSPRMRGNLPGRGG